MQSIKAAAATLGLRLFDNEVFQLSVSPIVEKEFNEWVAKHGKSYGTTEEYQFRLEQYALKHAEMEEINSQNGLFTVGHNFMSDWTDAEYKTLLGYKAPATLTSKPAKELDTSDLPESIDWRTLGAVNPVKNQARCGSCWSFSATCAIEGAHFKASGKLLSLSEQQFVDCDTASYGCNGGW